MSPRKEDEGRPPIGSLRRGDSSITDQFISDLYKIASALPDTTMLKDLLLPEIWYGGKRVPRGNSPPLHWAAFMENLNHGQKGFLSLAISEAIQAHYIRLGQLRAKSFEELRNPEGEEFLHLGPITSYLLRFGF